MAKARKPVGEDTTAGLCASCRHATRQESARGSSFLRCLRADDDPHYPRYPPLPVRICPGHEPGAVRSGR